MFTVNFFKKKEKKKKDYLGPGSLKFITLKTVCLANFESSPLFCT